MTEQMTEPAAHPIPAEVRDFVARVREYLGDLDEEERQELTSGLEADLADLVAERGADVLADPREYAKELRVAAGHGPQMAASPQGRGVRRALLDGMDAVHVSWNRLLDSLPGDPRGFLTAVQPVWWVARAWVAWMAAQDVRGPYVVIDGLWLAVLGVFVVISVQLGRGGWGLGRLVKNAVTPRLLLVGLNVFAVTMTPGAADRMAWHIAEQRGWQFGWSAEDAVAEPVPDVLVFEGMQVCELEVRDAEGTVIPSAYVWDVTSERLLPMRSNDC